jgi:trimeric autotransporter adhesin
VTVNFNKQDRAAADGFSVDLCKTLAGAPASGQVGDAACVSTGLAPGASGTCTLTINYSVAGTYNVWAQVDTYQQVAESSESNNRFGSRTVRMGASDLVVSYVAMPSSAKTRQWVPVSDITKNTGASSAAASTTKFYWSTDYRFSSGDRYLGARAVPALSAGASSLGGLYVQVPSGITPGTYYIVAVADANNAVAEINETNNTLARAIRVTW